MNEGSFGGNAARLHDGPKVRRAVLKKAMPSRFDPARAPTLDEWHRLHREHVTRLLAGYAAALVTNGFDGVVVHSGTPRKRSDYDDNYWPLRPTPHFAHWLPLAVPDCALIVLPGERPRLYRNTETSYWEAAPTSIGDWLLSELDVVASDVPGKLQELVPAGKRMAFVGEDSARGESLGIPRKAHNPAALIEALDRLRLVKSTYELRCIAEANRRAARGHHAIRDMFQRGESSEMALHFEYLRASEQHDYETPYQDIVAIGENAATLHHVHYRREADPRPAVSMLVDGGAAHHGYASDITRTYVRGPGSERFASLISGMEKLQQAIVAEVAVGVPWEKVHDGCHQKLGQLAVDQGLVSCSAEAAVASGITRKLLPHGLGHSLGVQVHDVGSRPTPPRPENPFLRTTITLAAGHVITVEPGCYFIQPLLAELRDSPAGKDVRWEVVAELAPFGGIRIEDDVAVLEDGPFNLTRPFVP